MKNEKLTHELFKSGKLIFTATSPSPVIDELLEYYYDIEHYDYDVEYYDHNISTDININVDNCSVQTIFILDNGVVKETTTLYDGNVPLKTWDFTYSKNNLSYVLDDEYYNNKFYKLERC